VLVVFYPLAFTGICTGELCAVRDDLGTFQNDDVQVVTVSVDSVYAHKVFSEREGYQFPLLADFWPHGDVARSYGVLDEDLGLALRGTFIIDKQGRVAYKVVNAIPDARDQDLYREVLARL
jgi:peroxiredoxin